MIGRVLYIIFLVSVSMPMWGQDDHITIDQLIQEAERLANDNQYEIGDQLQLWLQAFNLAQKSVDKYRLERLAIKLGDIFTNFELHNQALFYYKSILPDDFRESIDDINDISLIQKIGQSYSGLGEPDTAFYYYDIILNKFSYPDQINVLREVVDIYITSQRYDRALDYNLIIRDLFIEHDAGDTQLAKIYNNLGYNYNFLNNYSGAISNFEKALNLTPEDRSEDLVSVLINLGITYFNSGSYVKCISYLEDADKFNGKSSRDGEIDQLLATAYIKNGDYFNALKKTKQAEAKCKSTNNVHLLSDVYYTYAQIYAHLFEYDDALTSFQKHFDLRDSLDQVTYKKQRDLLQYQRSLEKTEKQVEIELKTKELLISELERDNARKESELAEINLENSRKENELAILRRDQEIQAAELENQELARIKNEQDLVLVKQKLDAEVRNRLIKDLRQQEEIQRLTNEKQESDLRNKEIALRTERDAREILQKDNAINELEIKRRKTSQRNLGLGAGLLSALLLSLYIIYRNKNKAHDKLTLAYDDLEEAQVQLKAAESRITGLLSQQVSGAVAQALISNSDASKVERKFVCIMFLDIRNYTGIAEVRKPEEIIAFQNDVFGFMINIIEKRHGVVNQLLGDGFMATFGAPVSMGNDTRNAYLSAREIISTLEAKVNMNEIIPIRIGIGLHSGYVVTGNVGNEERKQYSITGNTVILAARLEQLNKTFGSSLVISREVYDQLPPEDQAPSEFNDVIVKGRSTPISVASYM